MPELLKEFQPYFGKKVALYGLGAATEKALPELKESFCICGLLDSFTESGTLYGVPIISFEQAASMQVELIIVVARPGSCKAIVKRIKDRCEANGIALFDIRGKDLLSAGQSVYDFTHVSGGTKQGLMDKVRKAEAVSFDLFDTLITRKVLFPTDIFDLVDEALKERGIHIEDFHKKRQESEMLLLKTCAPKLEEIYEKLLEQCEPAPEISAAELALLEWELDFKTVIPREAVCEIFNELHRAGKTVSVVSDTFYRAEQLKTLLNQCGVDGSCAVFASCEYGVGKTQGLFDIYKKTILAETYLHIGDNEVADIDAASRADMDVFRLYNGADLLNEVGELGLGDHMDSLADRIRIGMFVSRIFNDPFQFETDDRRITVSKPEDIGYLFCAPLMSDFVLWFREKVQEYQLQNIWFSARDGYLIQKMYQELDPEQETVYFLTSRTAAIRAGMENKTDIAYVESMKFSGTPEDNLRVRFGIDAGTIRKDPDSGRPGLMQYSEAILDKAKEHRRNYLRYINKLPVVDGPIAFFDFVARGTTQLYVERLIPNHMKGLYFMRMEPEFMPANSMDIEPFYSLEEVASSAVFEDYYILETIVTAPHASVSDIDENGEPVYAGESRAPLEIACAECVQNGILEYFREYLARVPTSCRERNKILNERFLTMLHRISVTDKGFLGLAAEDPFFNRRTSLNDLF